MYVYRVIYNSKLKNLNYDFRFMRNINRAETEFEDNNALNYARLQSTLYGTSKLIFRCLYVFIYRPI